MNDGELSAERGRALRARHPLYARLNGEVVWMLYEELGWDAGQCGRYMDRFLADMQAALAVMDAVEQAPQRRFRIAGRTLPDGREECCPGCPCRQLLGREIHGRMPDWLSLLPPFAVGCHLRAVLVADGNDSGQSRIMPAPAEILPCPAFPLLCPLEAKQDSPIL
ncbi:MAG: hypothetical protein ACI33N_06475 [Desulfovibrionaceae bacterium]|nr:hypothetical protein [Desulfovibrionaceae bacterium]